MTITESLLHLLFPESAQAEEWAADPFYSQYLSDLTSFGISRLSSEPERLSNEKKRLNSETRELAFRNYKAFIQTAESSKEIHGKFKEVSEHNDALLESLPSFSSTCEAFLEKAQELSSARRLTALSLQHHTQLLELLEIPQLMDTCVRNGYYDEALDLDLHVQLLSRKHGDITLIQNIYAEVKRTANLMLSQLLQQLRGNIALPDCLRVVGYLRRLEHFSEAELRVCFLHARGSWLHSVLKGLDTKAPYTYLNKLTDVYRTHLFDIVTQYRSVFHDEAAPAGNLAGGEQLEEEPEGTLLHVWASRQIQCFLDVLRTSLPLVEEGALLSSLLGSCMYFGMSLGRVGLDFRPLVAPVFEKAVTNIFCSAVSQATRSFVDSLQPSALLAPTSGVTSSTQEAGNPLTAPNSLLDHVLLSVLANGYLRALNELRQCAPLAIAGHLARHLEASMLMATKAIADLHTAHSQSLTRSERAVLVRLAKVAAVDFVPFISRCFDAVYASVPGPKGHTRSPAMRLNTVAIIEPLAEIYATAPATPFTPSMSLDASQSASVPISATASQDELATVEAPPQEAAQPGETTTTEEAPAANAAQDQAGGQSQPTEQGAEVVGG
eukprot:Colp12_sorted_trinity150504_noHs@31980